MEFRRTEPPPAPPQQHPPPPLSYGGYRNPGFGLGDSFYNQGLGRSNDLFRLGIGQASWSYQMMNSVSAHPEILRELEKQRIREEIISGDIVRRRVLEEEVRAEMMMEKELRLKSNAYDRYLVREESGGLAADIRGISYAQEANNGISLEERFGMRSEDGLKTQERVDIVPFQQRSTESMAEEAVPSSREAGLVVKPRLFSFLQEGNKQLSLEEREESFKTQSRCENQSFEVVPFQRRSVASEVQKAAPSVTENVKQKEKIISKEFSFLQEGNEQLSLEERIAADSGEGFKTLSRCENQSLDVVPFQRRSVASEVQKAAPSVTENGKQKEKIISKEFSFLQEGNEQLTLEERIAADSGEGFKTLSRCENQSLDVVPFQRSNVQEPAPSVTENGKQKEKIVFLVKPSADQYGTKRKFESAGKGQVSVGYKRVKKTWTCDICQVCATSERGLNDHLGGKRHKAMEDALNGKNIGVGFVPKTTAEPITDVTSAVPNRPEELKVRRERVKKFAPAQKIKDRSKFPLWCEMCHVGAYSETVMEAHRIGKMHLAGLSENS